MYFENVSALWHMAGHGPFVWSAYAIAALVLVLQWLIPIRRSQRLLREYSRRLQREQAMAARANTAGVKES